MVRFHQGWNRIMPYQHISRENDYKQNEKLNILCEYFNVRPNGRVNVIRIDLQLSLYTSFSLPKVAAKRPSQSGENYHIQVYECQGKNQHKMIVIWSSLLKSLCNIEFRLTSECL